MTADPAQPYATAPEPEVAHDCRPLTGIARATVVLLAVTGLVLIVQSALLLMSIRLLQEFVDGRGDSGALDALDAVLAPMYLLITAVSVVTGVVWIVWQFRHAQNGRILGSTGALSHPGWAIGGWFIPIAQFFLGPAQLAASAKHPAGGQAPGRAVVWWAISFAAYGLLNRVAGRVVPPESATDQEWFSGWMRSDQIELGANVAGLVALILAVVVVRSFTAAQESVRPSR